ncbi:TPA: tyrosine-type recombinase/integrase [Enterobacter hormaechei subsp. xiangfangensis]|nr:tyrosine-type recombinase/integrase [Enterobacter hormaechei subsp. xiangfangensis]HAV1890546.1 tyrosine-type recombinase/integrase [Enterobacter hormaechei subsp. xiangfangensis]
MLNNVTLYQGNSLSTDVIDNDLIVKNLRELLRQSDAFSENTLKQLLFVFNAWSKWCQARNKPELPADPEDFKEYVAELRDRGLASTSIETYKTYLNVLHRHAGLPPLTADLSIGREMRLTRRRAAMAGEKTGQAIPLHYSDLQQLAKIWEHSVRLVDLRNLAALYMAYNTMLRVSELARIRVGELRPQTNGTMLVDVRYTKTDVNQLKILSRRTSDIVRRWLEASGLADKPEAFVIAPVTRFNRLRLTDEPMGRPAMERIFSAAWLVLDKPYAKTNKGRYATWTGHSCRVGAAQDLMLSGESLAAIMHEGSWRDPKQAMSYLRELEAQNSKLVKMLDRD